MSIESELQALQKRVERESRDMPVGEVRELQAEALAEAREIASRPRGASLRAVSRSRSLDPPPGVTGLERSLYGEGA